MNLVDNSSLIELTAMDMVNLSGGSMLDIRSKAMKFLAELGKEILLEEAKDVWNCFWDELI